MNAKVSVVEALSAVMEDVQAIKKGDRNTMQNFNFRGVDSVVNAVGPVLRKHGVVVVPTGTTWEAERYATAKGAQMRGVTLTISFRFYGPAGDYIDAQACGEASDAGDKAVPKAHSVAYRTLLLQSLCIPTDEPDPDSESHERATVGGGTKAGSSGGPGPTQQKSDTAAASSTASQFEKPLGLEESRADAGVTETFTDAGSVVLTFGKHSGKKIRDVPEQYLAWWTQQEPPKTDSQRQQRAAVETYLAIGEGL